jgi:hypothetical protein
MRLARLGFAALALASTLGLFAAAGCSSPVPPTPKGAWVATISRPSSACSINQHNTQVGVVGKSTRGDEVTDALDGASVTCEVTGSGTFKVSASASQAGKSLSISIGSIGKGATVDSPATGSLSYSSPNTAGNGYVSPAATPCKFWFEPKTGQDIAAGKVWLSFSCEAIRDDGHDSTCSLPSGFAIFENCSDGSTEE